VRIVVADYQPGRFDQPEVNPTDQEFAGDNGVVLIVDDSEADRFFLLRAFIASGVKNKMHLLGSGSELLAYLSGQGKFANRTLYPYPRIILLDIQMPPPNGFEVLRWKQSRRDLPNILWVAMSQFNNVRTINDAYSAGASTFLTKPLHGEDIKNLIEAFEDFWCLSPGS
jgi:CheY-like chemotaxis protein